MEELEKMTKAELDALPYVIHKWNCACKDCPNGTTVRDYGAGPLYFLNRNSKGAELHPQTYWVNLDTHIWYCGKHWKYFKRLGAVAMENRYIDWGKPRLGEKVKEVNFGIQKIG